VQLIGLVIERVHSSAFFSWGWAAGGVGAGFCVAGLSLGR
jgi:hypothetical protein